MSETWKDRLITIGGIILWAVIIWVMIIVSDDIHRSSGNSHQEEYYDDFQNW